MPTIYAGNESAVLVDGEAVEGVQSIEYRRANQRSNVYAVGGAERIGVVSGHESVEGRITIASASPVLDDRVGGSEFIQITARLSHGDSNVTLSFDECLLSEKSFALVAGARGESTYMFTATRAREERQ